MLVCLIMQIGWKMDGLEGRGRVGSGNKGERKSGKWLRNSL